MKFVVVGATGVVGKAVVAGYAAEVVQVGKTRGEHETVSGERMARAYVNSVEGRLTGQVFHVL